MIEDCIVESGELEVLVKVIGSCGSELCWRVVGGLCWWGDCRGSCCYFEEGSCNDE